MRMYATVILRVVKGDYRDHQGVEFVPLPWMTLHWAVGALLYKG